MTIVQVHATLDGFSRIDFDKKKIRKSMRGIGRNVRKESRRLVARRAISSPGEYPGKHSGKLQKSIKEKVSRSGFMVSIEPRPSDFNGGDNYYPAMLYYGVRVGARRRKDHKKQTLQSAYRIKPRGNFVVDAVENRREMSEAAIMQALKDSFKSSNEW